MYFSGDWFGHTGIPFLAYYLDGGGARWSDYDLVYEDMWEELMKTVDPPSQEVKVREMVKYLHDKATGPFIYSPITLYAVNKEVNFVPQKSGWLTLKETSVTDKHWSLRGERK